MAHGPRAPLKRQMRHRGRQRVAVSARGDGRQRQLRHMVREAITAQPGRRG